MTLGGPVNTQVQLSIATGDCAPRLPRLPELSREVRNLNYHGTTLAFL